LAFLKKPDPKQCKQYLLEKYDTTDEFASLICESVNFHKKNKVSWLIISLRKPPKPSEGARLYVQLDYGRSLFLGNFPLKKEYNGEFPEVSLKLLVYTDRDPKFFKLFCTMHLKNSPFFFGTGGFYDPEDICLVAGRFIR